MITTESSPTLPAGVIPAVLQRKHWITHRAYTAPIQAHQQLRAGVPDTALCRTRLRASLLTEILWAWRQVGSWIAGACSISSFGWNRGREKQSCVLLPLFKENSLIYIKYTFVQRFQASFYRFALSSCIGKETGHLLI